MKRENELRNLLTVWGEALEKTCPLNDYPRPQMQRVNWQCLNGMWEYAITRGEEPAVYEGQILVPFSPESVLSGVGRQLLPGQTLWYRRALCFEKGPEDGRLLLHFGAVDQSCTVWLNGVLAGQHIGGYWPFALDITALVKPGENLLTVAVTDDSDTGDEAWGKQKLKRGGIWYTAQSGIWQTVWCEWVPAVYIQALRVTPHWREGAVNFEVSFGGIENNSVPATRVRVLDGGTMVAEGTAADGRLQLFIPDFKSWSPEEPFLYDVEVTAGQDVVQSYFGMREFGMTKGDDGHPRFSLNGQPVFHTGLLDQGYWSDGLYTPPADEAMVWELEQVKAMGFNMLRKHIKIEPLRWYYHCDRLGILVWQDFVSGGGPYSSMVIQALPFVNIRLKDDRYARFGRKSVAGREGFVRDMHRTVELLYSAPCLAVWVPFNEGWGQFDALDIARQLRALDDTRPIDHASGWHDQGGGELASHHVYYKHFRPQKDPKGRALALTEFGGYSLPVPGHMATDVRFGYKVYDTQEKLNDAIERLYREEVLRYLPVGLAAAVYTQVSDVEDEVNGLFTYDRRVVKVDAARMRAVNAALQQLNPLC